MGFSKESEINHAVRLTSFSRGGSTFLASKKLAMLKQF